MSYQTLATSIEQGVLTVTLNRPERLNAFSLTMCDELVHLFESVNLDDQVKAIVVTGTGRAFCAGMDLKAEADNPFGLDTQLKPDVDSVGLIRDTGGRVSLAIYGCTKPVIGAVNGLAVGIGATMLLPMDIRLAATSAKFSFPFARLGIVNEGCSSWFLPRIVGMSQALEWLYKASLFSAEEAYRGGLVKEIVDDRSLLQTAQELALECTQHSSPLSTALIRQQLYRCSGAADPWQAHKMESLGVFYSYLKDGRGGVEATQDKRQPEHRASASSDLPDYFPWWQNPRL